MVVALWRKSGGRGSAAARGLLRFRELRFRETWEAGAVQANTINASSKCWGRICRDITGAIDGGSSGSPIVNASSQIVGQLSGTCGANPSDPCASGPGEANATVDGAFAADYVTLQPIINP